MTTPEQIEAVARAIYARWKVLHPKWPSFDELTGDAIENELADALAAIAAARPFIRAQALEEAARVCEECSLYDEDGVDWNTDPQVTLAAAIRALKEKT